MNKKEDEEEEDEEEERERRVSYVKLPHHPRQCVRTYVRKEKIKFPLIRPSTRITAESLLKDVGRVLQREHREVSAVDYGPPPPRFGVSYKTRGTATSKSSVQLCISIQANFPRNIMSSYSFAVKKFKSNNHKKISHSADLRPTNGEIKI